MQHPPDWTCELIVVRLERYLAGGLPRADMLDVAEHLEACLDCLELLWLLSPSGAAPDRIVREGGRRG
jgi:Putative zinc-finger